MSVRTRFAPSPTGYLHIGGVRTAIFNWLFAQRHGGQFILRIDDTDQDRHRAEALEPILHGFRWLDMKWDEGPEVGGPHEPYFQSQRREKYRAAATRLVDGGAAYPCFCTTEEIEAEREASRKAGHPSYRYSGRCRTLSAAERDRLRSAGRTFVLRFAVPPQRSLGFTDLILGPVAKETQDLGDFVIVRADGSPLYNFASVVDDIDMRITHVIRAQEHLSNTWPQWLLFEALEMKPPAFAHVPYVAAPGSKEKMSKRNLERYQTEEGKQKFRALGCRDEDIPNPVMLSYYEQLGYLPDAMINGLARIGWSLDDKQEKISRTELLDSFSLERVNAAPASFDPDKLFWLQGEYMKELPLEQKVNGALPHLQKANLIDATAEHTRETVRRVIEAAGDRMKVFSDIIRLARPLLRQELDPRKPDDYEPAAVQKTLTTAPSSGYFLASVDRALQDLPDSSFQCSAIEQSVREVAAAAGVSPGKIIHPLRVAVSGQTVGIGLFELIELLGPGRTHERIQNTIREYGLTTTPPSA